MHRGVSRQVVAERVGSGDGMEAATKDSLTLTSDNQRLRTLKLQAVAERVGSGNGVEAAMQDITIKLGGGRKEVRTTSSACSST